MGSALADVLPYLVKCDGSTFLVFERGEQPIILAELRLAKRYRGAMGKARPRCGNVSGSDNWSVC